MAERKRTSVKNKPVQRLTRYRAMRNFKDTPEPAGTDAVAAAARPRFVIQEHHASHLHWDFRLERDGVLVSWAVPKGLPMDPQKNHLAVHVEDHPLSYIDFAGAIPAGNYGAGKVSIWDRGTYDCHKFRDNEVMVTLHGRRARGKYVLFQTHGKQWMIHRMDPPARGYEAMPKALKPMLAVLSPLPDDSDAYAYEIKWDGIRALAYIDGGRVRFESRNGNDLSAQYPELRALGAELGAKGAILDGEIVALDEHGRPSFQRLQRRMGIKLARSVRLRQSEAPVVYMIFDVLYLDGRRLADLPYPQRRRRLEALKLNGDHWQTPAYHVGDGAALLQATRAQNLEGIVAKRLDSVYEAGKRTGAWRKIKHQLRQEFVIGGWVRGERHEIGSLLLGYYDPVVNAKKTRPRSAPPLHYAGAVGTGFTQAMLDALLKKLKPLKQRENPFDAKPDKTAVRFARPQLVAEIEFTEWTRAGTLRHPSFKGLRDDKIAREVVRETLDDSMPV